MLVSRKDKICHALNKKNILFISSWYPNKLEPTNGNFVQRHAEAAALMHHVEVLHAIGDSAQKEKFTFEDKKINGLRTLIVYYRSTGNKSKNFLRRMQAYQQGFRRLTKPDLVHANVLHNNMLFALFLKKKFGIPYVVTEHWTALRSVNHSDLSNNKKWIAKLIGNNASYLLPVSKDLGSGLKKLGITTSQKSIPNVVDTALFCPQEKTTEKFSFIHISNLISRKNPEKILRVAIKLMEANFDFTIRIGGDGDTSALQKIAEQSSFRENIEIFGSKTRAEVAALLGKSDCFVLFSDDENQPCVIGEAFACGIPVISTQVGGIPEYFPPGNGILIEKDAEELYKAMKKMLDGSYPGSTKAQLHAYAEANFSKIAVAKEFSAVYFNVLND